jgi:hypothetical protein
MSCRQLPLLHRLAVEQPRALDAPPWRAHLEQCPECRRERYTFSRSLAVFRQFESQPPPASVTGPSWEQFSAALAHSERRQGVRLRMQVPLAAASLLVAVSAGVLLWPVTQGPEPTSPAKIVTLKPEHAAQLRSVLNSSLQAPIPMTEGTDVSPQPMAVLDDGAPLDAPRATFVEDRTNPADAAPPGDGELGARPTDERAPVLLFRSLQQRRARQGPIQVMPVFAPVHQDRGGLLPRALLVPRPIR